MNQPDPDTLPTELAAAYQADKDNPLTIATGNLWDLLATLGDAYLADPDQHWDGAPLPGPVHRFADLPEHEKGAAMVAFRHHIGQIGRLAYVTITTSASLYAEQEPQA